MQAYKTHFIQRDGLKIHCIEYPNNNKPVLLCCHGLSANALSFNGLIDAGLNQKWHVLAIDFRGRGKSTKKAFQWSIKEHASDIIAVLDYFKLEKVSLLGHSFGGLMSSYIAYHYPQRIDKVFILDAAPVMNPKTPQMLMPALSRVDKKYKNFDEYLASIKSSEYMLEWHDTMLPYYKADVETFSDGSVECISDIADLLQISTHVGMEPWTLYFRNLKQASTLFVALDAYTLGEAILPLNMAEATVATMQNAVLVPVQGNHQTMLFGAGADTIVKHCK